MTNPLIVEAIEDQFVPLLVYNNRKGSDAKLLKHFNEPAWNNPVVRYLDRSEKDLVRRKELVLSVPETASRMQTALVKSGKEIPNYLHALAAPARNSELETATFAMYCFWEGEAQLGSIDGVYATFAGWRDGLEVVGVRFDPKEVEYSKLVREAKRFECASKVFAHSKQQLAIAKSIVGAAAVMASDDQKPRMAKQSDQKYYLANSPLKALPMCEFQTTKLNAALRSRSDFQTWLSPRQKTLVQKIVKRLKGDINSLDGFVTPINDNALGAYAAKLEGALNNKP